MLAIVGVTLTPMLQGTVSSTRAHLFLPRLFRDVLRVTYLDLARRWREMAHEAESLERKAMAPTKPIPRTAQQVSALSGSWAGTRPA